jgi:2'-5' RNA ligase
LSDYDWDAPGATALVVLCQEVEPVIGVYRREYTPSGREGMAAHVTLLVPFIHASRLSEDDTSLIRKALAPFEVFEVALGSFGLFETIGCLYLEPQPAARFVAMTEALLKAYAEIEYPPEGLEIVPHVTIGSGLTEEEQEAIKRDVAPRLPIRTRADRVVLCERGGDGRWRERQMFALS